MLSTLQGVKLLLQELIVWVFAFNFEYACIVTHHRLPMSCKLVQISFHLINNAFFKSENKNWSHTNSTLECTPDQNSLANFIKTSS